MEEEVVDKLLGGKRVDELSLEQIDALPYLNFRFPYLPFERVQKKTWAKLLPTYFDQIFSKPLIPQSARKEWGDRFLFSDYIPNYMMIYLGEKKPLSTPVSKMKQEVLESRIVGCQPDHLADYKNSFEYLIRTLTVLLNLKKGAYTEMPQVYLERLTAPFENRTEGLRPLPMLLD